MASSRIMLAAVSALCGCQSAQTIGVEPNDLGITSIEIDRTSESGTQVLLIHGLDAADDQVALATLRTGMIYFEPDWGAPSWTTGSDLTIAVSHDQLRHVAPDLRPHTIPEPIEPALASFVRLHAVAGAIEKQAGIKFIQPDLDETAFDAAACSGSNFNYYKADGSVLGNSAECCQDGTSQWIKIGAGANANKLGTRTLGTACRASDGSDTGCGSNCYFGPCGANAWGVTPTTTVNAKIFTPTTPGFTNRCGYDEDGAESSTGSHFPEEYVAQALKGGVTAGTPTGSPCNYTSCASGHPTYGDKLLTLKVYSWFGGSDGGNVTTSVSSYPSIGGTMVPAYPATYTGYYFGGSGQSPPAQSVVLTAHPAANYKAQWSNGPCVSTGGLNAASSCTISTTGPITQQLNFIYVDPCGTSCFTNENGCCQSNTGCFVAGTPIAMADGTTRPIEKVEIGDYVTAYDPALGRTNASRVTQTFVHEDREGFGTVLVNGTLRATPNHPFYANGKWVRADELGAGDVLMSLGASSSAAATPMSLDSLQSAPRVDVVYNLEVDTLHDYFAGGVLVHNKLPVCNCEQ